MNSIGCEANLLNKFKITSSILTTGLLLLNLLLLNLILPGASAENSNSTNLDLDRREEAPLFQDNSIDLTSSKLGMSRLVDPEASQEYIENYQSRPIQSIENTPESIISTLSVGPTTILGYHNLSEVETKLFNIAAKHPNIAKVFDLGKLYPGASGSPKRTAQNRPLYAIKISDNPAINESDEPDLLYMGLHHAREWISVEVMLYFLDYLIDNSVTNNTIKNIINNNELWLIPVVNPDGLFYSQNVRDDINNTNSNQWRKNRNESNGNPGLQDNDWARGDGVDLNRNYGYQWGYDNSGSSPDTNNQLYRGTAPFSEVETQLVRDLALARDFKLPFHFIATAN